MKLYYMMENNYLDFEDFYFYYVDFDDEENNFGLDYDNSFYYDD